MIIKESDLRNMVSSAVRKMLNESSPSYMRKKLINILYRAVEPFTKHKYRDDDWRNARAVMDAVDIVVGENGDTSWYCKDGGYERGEDWAKKVYRCRITMNDGIVIGAQLNCWAAGTVEDPFSSYDMTVTFYPEQSDSGLMNESGFVQATCTDDDAIAEWSEKTSIPTHIMGYINKIAQDNNFLIGGETVVTMKRNDGTPSAYAKGLKFSCDGAKAEFGKRFAKYLMDRDFTLADYENDRGATTYTLAYNPTIVDAEEFRITSETY